MNLPPDIQMRWMTYEPDEAGRMEALLSPDEKARLYAFTFARRRREFLLGRAAARLLLAERLGTEPAQVPLQVVEDGGVDVVGADVYVSIAHSGDQAVAAIGERRVGIDLERIAPRHPELRRFLLHPDEHAGYDALPLDDVRTCILYWTLKEASLKALRTGFRCSPKKLRLHIDLDAGEALAQLADGPHLRCRFEERDAFFCAVAFEEQEDG